MKPFDWVVFDSTGTLMTPEPEPAQVYANVGADFQIGLSAEDIRPRLKRAMKRHFLDEGNADLPTHPANERERWKRIVRDSLPGLEAGQLSSAFEPLWEHFARPDKWRLFDDVLPTIKRLREQGYRIAIASNFDDRLRTILDGMKVSPLFDSTLISADLGWSKPNTKFYDEAAARLGQADRSRILMIGDTYEGDVIAARAAGWNARHLDRKDSSLILLTEDL